MRLKKYVVLEKKIGETPLQCAEKWRATQSPVYHHVPLAYAGRLDPMASGKLLVLIGEECKNQERYHAFDKLYEFSILCGVTSDTHDILGRLTFNPTTSIFSNNIIFNTILKQYTGTIALPYPLFSAKTVHGKPLHTWTLEDRLNEITIPTQTSQVYTLTESRIEYKARHSVYDEALTKINSIPPVTEKRKALGNDFRRVDVRSDWKKFKETGKPDDVFPIIHLSCIASAGSYMRSLAHAIGNKLGTGGLAWHIHRTHIGRFHHVYDQYGWWYPNY